MKSLRGVLAVVLLLTAVAAIFVPGLWLYTANTLPMEIDSLQDIEMHLRTSVESERQSVQLAKREKDRERVKWERPDFAKLPKHLVELYVTETGCPTFFETPREEGAAWTKRVLWSVLEKGADGDGACELIFARRLARRLGARTPLQLAVAADKVHASLHKEQLVAYDLETMQFEHGLVGVAAAARELSQKNLAEMSLSELAELQLAIPPHGYWDEVRVCMNASLIKQSRDALLEHLAMVGFITDEAAKTEAAQPPRCLAVKR